MADGPRVVRDLLDLRLCDVDEFQDGRSQLAYLLLDVAGRGRECGGDGHDQGGSEVFCHVFNAHGSSFFL